MNKPDPHIAALKIWFAGLLLGPCIFILFASLFDIARSGAAGMGGVINLLGMFLWMIALGGILSFPSALALWLALVIQYRLQQSEYNFWGTLFCISLVLTVAPFAILTGFEFQEDGLFLGMAVAYIVGIWAGVFWTFRRMRH